MKLSPLAMKLIMVSGISVTAIISATVIAVIVITNNMNKQQIVPETVYIERPVNAVPVINEDNLADITKDIHEKVERGMFMTHMNVSWSFPDGKSASTNAVMGNSSANTYPFYFTVALSSTSEVIYTSSLLPVGSQVGQIILDKELVKGSYPCVLNINMIDDEGVPIESNMSFNITVNIRA